MTTREKIEATFSPGPDRPLIEEILGALTLLADEIDRLREREVDRVITRIIRDKLTALADDGDRWLAEFKARNADQST